MARPGDNPAALDPHTEAALFDFRELWHADAAAQRPQPLAHYLARFPAHEAAVAREWLLLQPPADAGELAEPGVPAAATDRHTAAEFGPYRVLQLLGRGGQGTVHLAEDTRLGNRLVALKVLDAAALGLSSGRRQRLRREAEALARLDHPGICAIHDAQLDGDRPYLAMRYVAGETLQATLANIPTMPRSTAELHRVLHWIERTALALHAAHEAGVVHRDVKPGNIVIDRDGLPVLLDFGLARAVDSAMTGLTMSGEVFGTLAYMPPELLVGAREPDHRADVYALGVTLYECLTRVPPFRSTSREAIAKQIATGRYDAVRAVNPAVPRDLAVVVATAMELNPQRRYATARAFADDLANVRERRPIRAHAARPWLRAARWAQRHPARATLLAVLLAGFAAVSFVSLQMRRQTRELLAWQRVAHAVELAATDPGRGLDDAVDAARGQTQVEIRTALHTLLAATWQRYERPAAGDPDDAGSNMESPPVLLPDGATIAAVAGNGKILTWDLATGAYRHAITGGSGSRSVAAALSTDRRWLVTGHFDGQVAFWDTAALARGERTVTTHTADARHVQCIAAARDAPRLFVGGDRGRLELFVPDANGAFTASPVAIQGPGDTLLEGVWPSPDGTTLLVHGCTSERLPDKPRALSVLDVPSGTVRYREDFPRSGYVQAEWSPRGDRFVVLEGPGRMRMLAADGRVLWQPEEQAPVFHAHFIDDGARLVAFGFPSLTVWDAASGERLVQRDSATGRSFEDGWLSPDGTLLAVSLRDSTLRLFETGQWSEVAFLSRCVLAYGRYGFWGRDGSLMIHDQAAFLGFAIGLRAHLPVLHGHTREVASVAFDPHGDLLASASADRTVRVWNLRHGDAPRVVRCAARPLRVASGSGARLLLVTDEPVARLLPWSGDAAPLELRGHAAAVTDGGFVAGGRAPLTIGTDGAARLWRDDGDLERTFTTGGGPLRTFAVDVALDLLALGSDAPGIHVFELSTGRLVRRLDGSTTTDPGFLGSARCLQFDRVHRRLYAAVLNCNGVACWDIDADWRFSLLRGMSAGSTGWAVIDAGCRVLICTENAVGTTRWFDAASLTPLPWEPAWEPGTMVRRAQFRSDGAFALLASYDGTVRLFDVHALAPWSTLRGTHGGALDATFSPDGERVAVGYKDGTVMVWPVDPLPAAEAHRVVRGSH